MRLRIPFLLFVGIMLLILLVLGNTLYGFRQVQPIIQTLERDRMQAHALIEVLGKDTQELAQMARAYAATGDRRFEAAYEALLDIRAGTRARGSEYMLYKGARQPHSFMNGLRMTYPDLLRQHALDADMLIELLALYERTEALVRIERQAIDLVNLQQADFARRAASTYVSEANHLLFSADFLEETAAISAALQKLQARVDQQISEQMAEPSRKQNEMILLAGILSLALLAGLIWLSFWGWHRVLNPLALMGQQAEALAKGDYAVRVKEKGFRELRQLAVSFNEMANAIECEIHALRLAEARLAASERHYRTLFDGAADAILLRPLSKPYVDANLVACKRLGYSREEFLALYPRDIMPPEVCRSDEELRALLQGKDWALFDSIALARDGRRIPVEVSIRLVDYDGEPTILSIHRDMTERLALQEEVQRAKDYAEQLIETANVMVLALDEQGRVQTFNAAAERITGYARQEVIGQDWFELIVPRTRYPDAWRVFENQQSMPQTSENPVLTRSGQERMIAWQNSILHVPGAGATMISFGVDVTDVRDAEKRMHQLVENAPLPMLLAEGSVGKVVFVNERFQSLLGYRSEDISDLATWEQLAYVDHTERAVPGQPDNADETLIRCKSGEERFFEVHHSAIGDVQLLMFVDLSERLQAEQQIAELGELNRMVIEKTTSGILVSNAQLEVVLANEAAEYILGAPEDSLLGLNLLNSPIARENGIQQVADQVLKSGVPGHFNGQYVTSFQRSVWLDVDFLRIRLRGENFLLAVFTDLSEIKEAEYVLVEAKRTAENANRSKSEFIANMSHEIRTPMNAVIGLSQLALGTELNAKQRDYLEKIHFSSRSLLGILNDILDYSKIEAGRLDIETVEFNLNDVLANVSNLFMSSAQAKDLEMVYAIDPAVPLKLMGDPLRISQVFSNLIGNAIKFTEHGEIDIFVNMVHQDDDGIVLEGGVHDTGIGMSAAQMQVLFAPFSQGDGSISRRYGGSGLGLAISRKLVELMGGKIHVDSEEGRGSSFRFTMRCKIASSLGQKQAATEPKSAAASGALAGIHVLLVEDNEINQQVASEFLHQAGIRTSLASNGQEALAWLERASFDAILMDIHMPLMNGLEATQRLRTDARWVNLPVIAMTAAVLPQDKAACIAAGMNDYIAKPIDPQNLLQVLLRWIKPHEARAEPAPAAALVDAASGQWGEFPGFDAQRIALISRGDIKLFAKLLASFERDFASAASDITRLTQAADWAAAHPLVHALKGASGNLGAHQLYLAALQLETELRAEEIAPQTQEACLRELDAVLRIARKLAAESEVKPSALKTLDHQACQRLLDKMTVLLDEQELVPDELLAALNEQFAEYASEVQRMQRALDAFDFIAAKRVLAELEQVLKNNAEGLA